MSEQLNKLAALAAAGDLEARDAIFRYFIPIVQEESRKIWYLVHDESSFEQECYKKIERAILKWRPDSTQSFASFVRWRINEVLKTHLKRRRRILPEYLEDRVRDDEGYRLEEILPSEEDVLADVEGRMTLNEKISALASGDPRRVVVLETWSCGFYNDSDIASLLAQRYGGNSESHRKMIQRFRTLCQKALTVAV